MYNDNVVTIPDFVDYPSLYNVEDNFSLFDNIFCYVIENYCLDGFTLYLGFRDDCFLFRMSDFNSNEISYDGLNDASNEILSYVDKMNNVMKSARIPDALFYFSNNDGNIVLVDMMLSANKFVGPGMLRDLFGNIVKTQGINTIEIVTKETVSKYKGSIVKPSRFRYSTEENVIRPIYGII